MRERLYYQREGQPVLYEEANRNYNNCHAEISDNLIKQAKTIYKFKNESEFADYLSRFGDVYRSEAHAAAADHI